MKRTVAFELSMPNVGSWNGKWSGADRCYVKVMKVNKDGFAQPGDSHRYNFGDGWSASVSIREVDGNESRRLKRKSAGFCGYDWMINDILTYGYIKDR